MSDDLLVRIDNLTFEGKARPLIERLTMLVTFGSVTSILAPTGAGKSTLLKAIAGLENRFVGSISLGGVQITHPSRAIQLVFQDYRLLPWKTVENNLRFAAPYKEPERSVTENVADLLGEMELTEIATRWPKDLSGGQRAGVAFARAFMDPPKVLLLDEPFNGMDLRMKYELQERLTKAVIKRHTTLIVVCHSVNDAVFLSDAVYVFREDPLRIEAVVKIPIPRGTRDRLDPVLQEKQRELTGYLLRAGQ